MLERLASFEAFKEGRRWYVDDNNGYDKDDNELVAGVPQTIEALAGRDAKRVEITASDTMFNGAVPIHLTDGNSAGGVEYEITIKGKSHVMWLCKVFWSYFDKRVGAPETLYVRIRKV